MCWSSGCFPSLCGWCEVSNLRCGTSQYSHWSEQWVCCVAICTKVVEVAAFIDHTDRCRLQAQRGLNARELWACGYMVSVRPGQPAAESRWYSTCHFGKEQIMIFHGAFYFLKVDFACFAFLFLPPFTDKPFVGFCVFSSFVSRSVVSLPVLQFYLTNLSTLWYPLNNSLSKNYSELLLGCIKWNQRQQSVTGRTTTSWENKGSRRVNADGGCLLCLSSGVMPFSSACSLPTYTGWIPPQSRTELQYGELTLYFHSHSHKKTNVGILVQLISSKDDLSAGQQLLRNERVLLIRSLQTFRVGSSSDPVEPLLAGSTVERGAVIPPIVHHETRLATKCKHQSDMFNHVPPLHSEHL